MTLPIKKEVLEDMKYALVKGERQEAQPSLRGRCICCDSQVIAKCGAVRVRHWAHRGMCDPWWEGETEWHRAWKGLFPKEWQEVVHFAENGEKHIADVKTDQNCVIEFQHSPIKLEERQAREEFYKKMIWIVDGTTRKNDKKKFIETWDWLRRVGDKIEVRELDNLHSEFFKCPLFRDWSNSKALIFFDFEEDILWGLLPRIGNSLPYLFKIDRNRLIMCIRSASKTILEDLSRHISIDINNKLKSDGFSMALQEQAQPRYRNLRRHWRL